jgi:hypothetical protein
LIKIFFSPRISWILRIDPRVRQIGHSQPVIGVPSASSSPDYHDDPAGYNLYEIDGEPGAWRCTLVARGWNRDDRRIAELRRQPLMG